MTVRVASAAVGLFAGRMDDNSADQGETSEAFIGFKGTRSRTHRVGVGRGRGRREAGEREESHVEKQEQGRTRSIQIATGFCQFRKLCSSPILGA